jgi:NhaP-type Na+/H+ or K+/H+ antiporter
MRLLLWHKILVSATLVLCVVLIIWGAVHWFGRHEPNAWIPMALGAVMLPTGALYLRKLFRSPPIRP